MRDIYQSDYYDSLTKLPNLQHLRKLAQKMLEVACEHKTKLAFVYFNIENFKSYNARYGMEGGDYFLQVISQTLQATFQGRIVARTSDDHFIVIASPENLEQKIEEIYNDVHSLRRGIALEMKAGIYFADSKDEDATVACDRAKLACDSIKNKFDIHFAYYDTKMSQQVRLERYVVEHLDKAIAERMIKPFYQPVVRAGTEHICGVEVLARWIDPERGLICPEDFIGILEERHLIHKLDMCILKAFCEDFSARKMAGKPLVPASINLSRVDFRLTDIVHRVDACVRTYAIPPAMIHIEITESAFMDDSEALSEAITLFHKLGYQVWMDDFGAGYSSLDNLRNYEFDALKIDMKFLKGFNRNPRTSIILACIIDMAKRLHIQTVSEGVENREIFEFMKSMGCEKIQGFLFGRPMPLYELDKLGLMFETAKESDRQDVEG